MSDSDDKTKSFEQLEETSDFNKQAELASTSTRLFTATEKKPLPPLPIHRQARGLMKTAGALVGRDTEPEQTLFDAPRFHTEINPLKATLSRNTAITANLLIALWQKNKNDKGFYTIDNLTEIAKLLNIIPQELKLYLIYLGGYQRPITKLNIIREKGKKDKRILSIYHDKLFLVRFNILLKDKETENDFTNDDKIGTNYCSFIKDRDITSVDVAPSTSFIEELQGRGLGNVLVDDGFVAFSLGLSDLAYKLFCFSGSNKPNYKINFDKLIEKKNLNLERQIKGEYTATGKRLRAGKGKPKILAKIQEALTELKDKGHLTKWAYDEATELFSWTYSSKIIKHRELMPPKTEQAEETGQTRQ